MSFMKFFFCCSGEPVENEKNIENTLGNLGRNADKKQEDFIARIESFGALNERKNLMRVDSFGAPPGQQVNMELSLGRKEKGGETFSPVFGGNQISHPSFSNFGGGNISAISGNSNTGNLRETSMLGIRGLEETKDQTGEKLTPTMGNAGSQLQCQSGSSNNIQKEIIVVNKIQRRDDSGFAAAKERSNSIRNLQKRSELNSTPVLFSRGQPSKN